MQDKVNAIAIYAMIGLMLALLPLIIPVRVNPFGRLTLSPEGVSKILIRRLIELGLLVLVIGVLYVTRLNHNRPVILLLALGSSFLTIASGSISLVSFLSSFLAAALATTLLWWRKGTTPLQISSVEVALFFLLGQLVIRVFSLKKPPFRENSFPFRWLIGYSIGAGLLVLFNGPSYVSTDSLWHHWSAYIGPAELLLSGAIIFRDFPAQYGLGPTSVIASVCGNDCWVGMYYVTVICSLAHAIIISALALALSRNYWKERALILALAGASCFLWIAYPAGLMSPISVPSVSGLRFLPALVMTSYLFFVENIWPSRTKLFIAHGLWALGVLWSPESAFYITFIWWPYYLFIGRAKGTFFSRLQISLFLGGKLVIIALGTLSISRGIFQLIYKEYPTLLGLFTYVIHPPGPMPMDPHGSIWFMVFTIIIGAGTLWTTWRHDGDTLYFRRGFLIQLLCYAGFSYFFGRSHDNNILNLMPLMFLVLLYSVLSPRPNRFFGTGTIMLAAIICWLPTFNWKSWAKSGIYNGNFTFNPSSLVEYARRRSTAPAAVHLLEKIKETYHEPVTLVDNSLILLYSKPPAVWNGAHIPGALGHMPPGDRREFITNTARTLKRPGWLLINKNVFFDEWLADFDVAYTRTQRIDFENFYALRFSPK